MAGASAFQGFSEPLERDHFEALLDHEGMKSPLERIVSWNFGEPCPNRIWDIPQGLGMNESFYTTLLDAHKGDLSRDKTLWMGWSNHIDSLEDSFAARYPVEDSRPAQLKGYTQMKDGFFILKHPVLHVQYFDLLRKTPSEFCVEPPHFLSDSTHVLGSGTALDTLVQDTIAPLDRAQKNALLTIAAGALIYGAPKLIGYLSTLPWGALASGAGSMLSAAAERGEEIFKGLLAYSPVILSSLLVGHGALRCAFLLKGKLLNWRLSFEDPHGALLAHEQQRAFAGAIRSELQRMIADYGPAEKEVEGLCGALNKYLRVLAQEPRKLSGDPLGYLSALRPSGDPVYQLPAPVAQSRIGTVAGKPAEKDDAQDPTPPR